MTFSTALEARTRATPLSVWQICGAVLLWIVIGALCSARADEPLPSMAAPGAVAANGPDIETAELVDANGALSLQRLIAQVLLRNPSVAAASHALRAASERAKKSGSLDDPMFSYMLGPRTLGSADFSAAQRFEISQPLPWPGKRHLRTKAAEYEAESVGNSLNAVREQLSFEMRAAFVDLWLAERGIEINKENQTLISEIAEVAEQRYGTGSVTKQDVLQANAEREMFEHDGAVLLRTRNRSTARINTLLNQDPEADLPCSPRSLVETTDLRSLAELKADAERSRPELGASSARIHSLEVRTTLARKEFFPDFSVSGGYDSFWREEELRPSVGFSINLPIQTGRRRAGVAEANAELARAQSEHMKIRADILLEVESAYLDVEESREGITLYESHLLPNAKENLDVARTGYAAGQSDFAALTSAQKFLIDIRLKAIEFQASYHNGMAKLRRAIGTSSATTE